MAASTIRRGASARRYRSAVGRRVQRARPVRRGRRIHRRSGAEMLGFSARRRVRRDAARAALRCRSVGRGSARVDAADVLRAESCRFGRTTRRTRNFELTKFREWGWDASIETFSVLYPTPREVSVELVAPTHFTARLTEPAIAGDAPRRKTKDELPAYNVYGADGDVTAELVYVNQGMPDDYKELERQGVSVKGRIVLTRYGGGWRGLKPKLAYEHGAVGCLIYSDPRDDGYGAGDTYPKGGYRPRDAVQRGSVQDLTLYSGDPLTPGVGAYRGRQATGAQGCQDAAENSGAADFLRRRRAAARRARRPGRAGGVARRTAADLSPGSGPRESAHEGAVGLESEDRCTTSSRRFAAAKNPIDGSFAAIITTAGCSAPPIPCPARWR